MPCLPSRAVTALGVFVSLAAAANATPFTLTSGTYTQDFFSLGTGTATVTLPDGWDVRSDATSSTLGSTVLTSVVRNTWSATTGQFRNVASATGLSSSSDSTAQNASTDRALGLRQTGSFGDPGAAFNFNFSSTGITLTGLTFDLMLLSEQTRTTTWQVQYGLGTTPSSFTTITTTGSLAPTTWGTYPITVSDTSALAAMSNQTEGWLRIVTTATATPTSGSRDTLAIDNVSITAVPEPATLGLAAIAMAGLAGSTFRRRLARQEPMPRG